MNENIPLTGHPRAVGQYGRAIHFGKIRPRSGFCPFAQSKPTSRFYNLMILYLNRRLRC